MDLGFFKYGRPAFAAWLVGPVAVLLAVCAPSAIYCARENKDCELREAILRHVPEMKRQAQRANDTLKKLASAPGEEADNSMDLNLRIQRLARRHGLGVRSLTIEKRGAIGKSGVSAVAVKLRVEGALPAIIEAFSDLRTLGNLPRVESLKMKAVMAAGEPVYSCEVASQFDSVTM